jgi:hypothetical protein
MSWIFRRFYGESSRTSAAIRRQEMGVRYVAGLADECVAGLADECVAGLADEYVAGLADEVATIAIFSSHVLRVTDTRSARNER